jgi:hypothetical protein
VTANVGTPLGIVVGQSETAEIYGMFAQVLFEQGTPRDGFTGLPLLSDEGSALASYARSRGQKQFFCYRHIIESLGAGTFVALLARRLMFTKTRPQFDKLIPQTMSDFALGVRLQIISAAGAQKFAKVFGLHWPSGHGPDPDPTVVPFLDETFAAQALWGERGRLGVATCTNHVEGLHGRLNHAADDHLALWRKLATITEILKKGAKKWEKKISRSQKAALQELITRSNKQEVRHVVCPVAECDHGYIMSQRYAMVAPCVHVAWNCDKSVNSTAPSGLDLSDSGPPRIETLVYQGSWSSSRASQDVQQRPYPSFEEEYEDDGSPDSVSGFLARTRRELRYMQQGKEFPDTEAQMAYRLGWIRGRLEEQRPGISSVILRIAVRSQFLTDCARVQDGNSTWDD